MSFITLVVVLASPGAFAASGDLMFATPFLSRDVGCPPGWLTVGDLNRDGKQDLVVAHLESGGISVLMGNGNWAFGSPVDYTTGYYPGPVAIADLDGDGTLDLVAVVGQSGHHVTVLRGDGTGAFGPGSDYATGGWPNSLAIGDVSGDGSPDLIVTTELPPPGAVSVLIGNGNGTFAPKTDYVTKPQPKAVAIGDLNGDGVADLAVAAAPTATDSGSVSVMLGTGGGVFGPAIWSAPRLGLPDVGIGDLNGDGGLDLVVASDSQVSVFLGDGSGAYGTPTEYDCPGGSLLLTDLNGDGRLDVASAGSSLSVMLGAGDGTLGACNQYYAGVSPATPAFADLNGDGKRDIVVANRRRMDMYPPSSCPVGTVSMLAGNGDGTFGTPPSLIEPGQGVVALRDLNRDGRLDLVTASTAGTVGVLLGDGKGGFGARTDFPVGADPGAKAIGDLNGDGNLDLVVAHPSSNALSVLLGVGDGTFGPNSAPFATGPRPTSVAIADFNRDGEPDLVTANRNVGARQVSVLLGYGSGAFAPHADFVIGSGYQGTPTCVAAEDFNGDGIPDLAVALFGFYDQPTWGGVYTLRGNGDGTFGVSTFENVTNATYVTTGDLNLDGRPDLAVTSAGGVTEIGWEGPGYAVVRKGNGDGTFTGNGGGYVGEYPSMVAIQDFDGDGKPDLAITSSQPLFSILPGRGDGTFGARTDYGTPSNLGTVVSGDIDRDGRPDLALSTTVGVMLHNVTPNWPTPTLLSLFNGVWCARGIELRWEFVDPTKFASVAVERSESAVGPWRAIEGERWQEGGAWVLLDRGAEAGRTHFYRLLAPASAGEPKIFGPLEVTSGAAARGFALRRVAPNPGHDQVRIGFTVAHPARVRLGVLDVQGRHVAQLVDEVREPGEYEVVWDGATEGARAPAGLYFVRFEAAGVRRVERFALTR